MTKTYAVGDMHGRHDLLLKTLDMIEADAGPAGGTFVVLGDFVDRGPESRQIIETLMAGPRLPEWSWIVLQGNHEAMMLEVLADTRKLRWWIGNGGGETLRSYGYQHGDTIAPLRIPMEHLEWLGSLPIYHEDDQRIFVHAGVPHNTPLEDARRESLQWMLYRGREFYADAEMHDDLPHCSGKHIVHGHHQSANHPLILPHRTNLDSFAWRTDRLAIGVFDDSQPSPVKTMDAMTLPTLRPWEF